MQLFHSAYLTAILDYNKIKSCAIVHPIKEEPALKIIKSPQLPCLSNQFTPFSFDSIVKQLKSAAGAPLWVAEVYSMVYIGWIGAPLHYYTPLVFVDSHRLGSFAFSGGQGAFLGKGGTYAGGVRCVAKARWGSTAAQRYVLVLRGDVILGLHKRRKSGVFYAQPDDISSIE